VRSLGKGGVGEVFEVSAGKERAAIKILLREWTTDPSVVERFVREARALTKLHSERVCRILDVGNLSPNRGDRPYMLLELLDGADLHRLRHRAGGRLDPKRAMRIMADACEGVAHAHDQGIVHRDLKPSNIFLAKDAAGVESVKVLDFGIAKLGDVSARITRVERALGTPHYMSPEQMITPHEVGPATDAWSMGVTLYEIVSGESPFEGRTQMELTAAVITKNPPPPSTYAPEVPKVLDEIVARCLRKAQGDRYPSMRALGAALADAAR
jgi:serine/threonine-protein kinase